MSIAESMRTVQLESENRELRTRLNIVRKLIAAAYCQGCTEQFGEDHDKDTTPELAYNGELYHAQCSPDRCSCGEKNNNGEGWDGKCGNCADIQAQKNEEIE